MKSACEQLMIWRLQNYRADSCCDVDLLKANQQSQACLVQLSGQPITLSQQLIDLVH